MTENTQTRTKTSVWPPKRKPRAERASGPYKHATNASKGASAARKDVPALPLPISRPSLPPPPPPPLLPLPRPTSPEPSTPLSDVLNQRKRKVQYRNGWEATTKPPSYIPYELDRSSRKRLKLSNAEGGTTSLGRHKALSEAHWNALAHDAGLLKADQGLKDFQMQCANGVISRLGDTVVIAPTGAGKSMVWMLPLLVVKEGICIVVTPYTSLGIECEQRAKASCAASVFVYAEQHSEAILTSAEQGFYRIIFVCPEMLENPTFAPILHSKTVQSRLLAVYIDEAHLVHESVDWRNSYERLHKVRSIIGSHIPLVAISATLPRNYRHSLLKHAGLRDDYRLINLGNFRPELSTVVVKLEANRSSFDSLEFILPDGARIDTIRKSIVYCDDVTMLTNLLWWFDARLKSLSLPGSLVEILHAGLSPTHENIVMKTFNVGEAKIFLATEKVGAGINFPEVEQVIVYLVQKDLTLAKFEQRKGRAGRTSGSKGVGILMVQPDLLSPQKSSTVDPGILDLIQTKDCMDLVVDRWLNNPPRTERVADRLCCSNCHPSLHPSRSLQWVMEDPASKSSSSPILTDDQLSQVLETLRKWREHAWEQTWSGSFPGYAPEDLLADEDLENVAKHALTISTVEDLSRFTRIVYWSVVAPSLFTVLTETCRSVLGTGNGDATSSKGEDVAVAENLEQSRSGAEVAPAPDQVRSASLTSSSSGSHAADKSASTSNVSTQPIPRLVARRPAKVRIGTRASKFGEQVMQF